MAKNDDLKNILQKAIDACVACAFEAESVKHHDNPLWMVVTRSLDECSDNLREHLSALDAGE